MQPFPDPLHEFPIINIVPSLESQFIATGCFLESSVALAVVVKSIMQVMIEAKINPATVFVFFIVLMAFRKSLNLLI
jgi:hypothetical protein